jgi:hypothetical protein
VGRRRDGAPLLVRQGNPILTVDRLLHSRSYYHTRTYLKKELLVSNTLVV